MSWNDHEDTTYRHFIPAPTMRESRRTLAEISEEVLRHSADAFAAGEDELATKLREIATYLRDAR